MSEVISLRPKADDVPAAEARESALVFSNPGSLDINLVKLLGVSVKENDSPIGFFGTGLKYAMATALRLGGAVTIITGGVSYQVHGKGLNLRGKDFTQVFINEEALGFTTELGKQWEAWMVVRELYSNTLDEKGEVSISSERPEEMQTQDRTVILLHGQAFLDVWALRGQFFIDRDKERPIMVSPFVEAYEPAAHSHAVFYKGIKIWDSPVAPLYRYNMLGDVTLTEDRTLRYSFHFTEAVEKAIITSRDPKFIHRCLTAPAETREGKLEFSDQHTGVEMSEEFQVVCSKLNERAPANRHRAALRWWKARTMKSAPIVEATLTKVQRSQLDKSTEFLRRLGYGESLDKFPILVVTWLGENIFGRAENDTVYIGCDIFDKGTKYVASTILEELVHLQYGFQDECRPMQTWLFDRIITMGEEHVTGEAL